MSLNEPRVLLAALAGESIAFYLCDTCGWVDDFEVSIGLPSQCPRCQERNSLDVQNI